MKALRVSHLSDARQFASAINNSLKKSDALSLSTDQLTLNVDRAMSITGNITVSGVYKVGANQVLGARSTGWTADSGTASKASFATYGAPVISNPPTQAEVQAIANALQNATQELKAIKDALMTHGLLGA